MKIVHLTVSDCHGAAAESALRLHLSMRKLGVSSVLLAGECRRRLPGCAPIQPKINFLTAFFLRLFGKKQEFSLLSRLQALKPDAVFLHDVTGVIEPELLPELKCPLFWVIHDSAPYTADEQSHAPEDRRFESGAYAGESAEGQLFRRKYDSWHKLPLTLLPVSEVLAQELHRSLLFQDTSATVLPDGVDLSVFHPAAKVQAKKRLGIDPAATTILLLPEAEEEMGKWAGQLQRELKQKSELLTGKRLKKCDTAKKRATLFQAADLLFFRSGSWSVSRDLIEAMACGVPAVGTDAPAVADAVIDGWNGRLVPPETPAAAVKAAREILRNRTFYADGACEYAATCYADLTIARRALDQVRLALPPEPEPERKTGRRAARRR